LSPRERARLAALLLCAPACTPTQAAPTATVAQSSSSPNMDRARELNEAGVAAFRANHFRDAIQYFRESRRLGGDPLVLWNEARCHELLDEAEIAAQSIEEYLKQPGLGPEDRAEAQRKLTELRNRPSRVTVVTTPPGAAVTIDNQLEVASLTPVSTVVTSGAHTIVVKKNGYSPAKQEIEGKLGRAIIVEIDLTKASR
jgi:hypothetical protein